MLLDGSINMPTIWRLMDVIKEATVFLESKGIEDARLNAERLLAHVLGISRVDLYLQFDQPLKLEERNTYKTFLRRRAENEPLQYIIGETEFMSLPFRVTPDVLIPRPETEILVEQILEARMDCPSTHILDIGVGSGCISVSLANYLEGAHITGVDINPDILAVAQQNAENNNVADKIEFHVGDVSKGLDTLINQKMDIIVSNPPYVSQMEWNDLPTDVREFEPKHALDGGNDGLKFYRIIAAESKKLLKVDGAVFLEVGYNQSDAVKSILIREGFPTITAVEDLNNTPRVIIGQL